MSSDDAFKSARLSSHEYYQVKRWEGKPWRFKLKFLVSNYPEFALGSLLCFVICPAIVTYKYYSFSGSRAEAISKYKAKYTVIRDDDPDVEKFKKEKERGRHFFPRC